MNEWIKWHMQFNESNTRADAHESRSNQTFFKGDTVQIGAN